MLGENFGAITVVGVSARRVVEGTFVTGGGDWRVAGGATVGSGVYSGVCV
jgi:hypothetical protein